MPSDNLNQKVVLVAGGRKNLAELISRDLARKGASVVHTTALGRNKIAENRCRPLGRTRPGGDSAKAT